MAKSAVFVGTNASESVDYRIDYDVTMPAGNRLDITNRHGNSTIAALNTSVKIDQKYGDFRLDGASAATVVLAFGGGELSALNNLNGTVSYGRLTSPSIKTGRINSIYSQLRFDQIGSLEVLSAYDTYEINDILNLKCKCKYSAINVRNVDNLTAEGVLNVTAKAIVGNGILVRSDKSSRIQSIAIIPGMVAGLQPTDLANQL